MPHYHNRRYQSCQPIVPTRHPARRGRVVSELPVDIGTYLARHRESHADDSRTAADALVFAPPPVAVDDLDHLITRSNDLRLRIAEMKAEDDAIRAAIQDRLGTSEIGTVHGLPRVRWTHHIRHALDATALKKTEPMTWARYAKTTTYRRFTLIDESGETHE